MSPPDERQPLYDRLGGIDAIAAAVDAFHDRVAEDDRVNHYFQGAEMDALRRHQAAFFAAGTGGSIEYRGGEMQAIHAGLGIDDEDFDIFVGHLDETLRAFDVPAAEREELLGLVEDYRSAVVAR